MKKRPILFSIIIVILMYGLVYGVQKLPIKGVYAGSLFNLIAAIPTVLIFLYLFGKQPAKFSLKGLGYGLRKGLLFILIVNTIIGLLMLYSFGFFYKYALKDQALLAFIFAVLQCLILGVFEEFLFRGILLNLPLTKYKSTYSQVITVVILESFVFGFYHVVSSFFTGEITGEMLLQIFLKTLQTGIMGFIYSALTLKIRNIWPSVLLHGYFDFTVLMPAVIFTVKNTGFVNGNSSLTVMYIVSTVIALPALVHAVKMLKSLELPCVIMGDEEFKPRTFAKEAKKAK